MVLRDRPVRLWTSGKRRIAICPECRFDSSEEAFMGCIVPKLKARNKSRKTKISIGASHTALGPVGCPCAMPASRREGALTALYLRRHLRSWSNRAESACSAHRVQSSASSERGMTRCGFHRSCGGLSWLYLVQKVLHTAWRGIYLGVLSLAEIISYLYSVS